MKTIYLDGNKFEWSNIEELREEARKYNVIIHANVLIDSNVYIGSNARIGSDVTISFGVKIDSDVIIHSSVKGKVLKCIHLDGLYKYSQDIIFTDEDIYIRMGCFTRTIKEWKEDFNNNEEEFPIGLDEWRERLDAINVCMKILGEEEIKGDIR